MTLPRPSLDPRKSPWKRGDVCTLGFEELCFVLSYTPEYLEVFWLADRRVERIPSEGIDQLLRVAHADELGPDGSRTNLEYLQAAEATSRLQRSLTERMQTIKSEKEKKEMDRLVRRAFAEGECLWDQKNSASLLALVAEPKSVGIIFKVRERIHRFFCRVT
ncbi:MAG TPA: hypothetical protein VKZ53_02830 [Candidatus Angelobacter sp.]|nr:hypothetical protein [Candidatus Angelobacter sp.]